MKTSNELLSLRLIVYIGRWSAHSGIYSCQSVLMRPYSPHTKPFRKPRSRLGTRSMKYAVQILTRHHFIKNTHTAKDIIQHSRTSIESEEFRIFFIELKKVNSSFI